jgi:hypothetical protein
VLYSRDFSDTSRDRDNRLESFSASETLASYVTDYTRDPSI